MAYLSIEASLALGWKQTRHAVQELCVSCPCCDCLIAIVDDAKTRCHLCGWRPGEPVERVAERPPPPAKLAPEQRLVPCPCGTERSNERDLSTSVVEQIEALPPTVARATAAALLKSTSIEIRACRHCGSLYIPRPTRSPPLPTT